MKLAESGSNKSVRSGVFLLRHEAHLRVFEAAALSVSHVGAPFKVRF
jgi:hypothetical protein